MTDAARVQGTGAPIRAAWGWGLASIHVSGQVLDTYFPSPRLGVADDSAAPTALISAVVDDEAREVRTEIVLVEIDLDARPASTSDAYLRLHLLSHRLVRPRTINMDGIFASLPNVVWTSAGPCAIEGFERVRTRLRARGGHLTIYGVDKFPRMVDYVVPTGVRVADADRVRLGAHLAEGTTVMHEGFVNFNAGTLGTSMVEGRISAGVVSVGIPMLAAAHRSWAPCREAARKSSRSASGACSVPTPVSGSPWVTTALWKPGSTSRPAPRSPCRAVRWSRHAPCRVRTA